MHFQAHFYCLNLALFFIFFGYIYERNWIILKTLKVTPAMAARISNTLWSMNDVVAMIDAKEAWKDRSREKYKTKN